MKWQKPLRKKNGEARKSFRTWQVPKRIRTSLGLEDGRSLDLSVQIGKHNLRESVVLTSGGEYTLSRQLTTKIEDAISADKIDEITFGTSLLPNNQSEEEAFYRQVKKSLKSSREDRMKRLSRAKPIPQKREVTHTSYIRNADVVAEVLLRANGHCERCKAVAPFLRKADRLPYLEVHHKVWLSRGGEDTLANAIALCPNCHRELHFGV